MHALRWRDDRPIVIGTTGQPVTRLEGREELPQHLSSNGALAVSLDSLSCLRGEIRANVDLDFPRSCGQLERLPWTSAEASEVARHPVRKRRAGPEKIRRWRAGHRPRDWRPKAECRTVEA